VQFFFFGGGWGTTDKQFSEIAGAIEFLCVNTVSDKVVAIHRPIYTHKNVWWGMSGQWTSKL